MKRASVIIALLLVVVVGAFALDATVTWSWSQNDPDVKFFRYQLDGEEDGKWVVVDSNVLSSSHDIDVSVEHTLYLQQSYDGVNWSASSHTVAAAVDEETFNEISNSVEPTEAAEAVAPVETSEAPVEVPETAVEEPVVVPVEEAKVEAPEVSKAPAKAAPATYPARSRIDLGAAYANVLPFDQKGHLVGASLGYTFLFGRTGSIGFGAKVQFAAYTVLDTFKDLGNYKNAYFKGTLDAMLLVDYAASWGDIYLGVGGEVSAPFASLDNYAVGVAAQLGTRIKLGKTFGFGLEAAGCYYLYPTAFAKKNEISAKAYLSFEF